MKYWDVLRVQEDFVKVFSEEADEERKDLWKTFIPHEHFKDFFMKTLRILESEGHIWLYGAYGTGKTHGAFVMKHLLEDPWEEIEDFIGSDSFNEVERNYLRRVRNNGKVLVVYKDGANEVTNALILMNVVGDSILRKLKKMVGDLQSIVESLREKIANLPVDWNKFVERYYKGDFSSGEELRMAILNEGISPDMLSRVLENLMNEGIGIRFSDVEELRDLVNDIVNKTEYKRILFIWDEFTSFFDTPNPPMEAFQRIVQEIRKPLHFIVITHRAPEQFRGEIKKDLEKVKDRFEMLRYEMKEPTAVELISRARKIVNKTEFEKVTYRYFSRYDDEMRELMSRVLDIDDKAFLRFKEIFPIHPYSMKILVDIVHHIGSSQRSLFEFLFDEKGFKRFLKEYPKNDWEVLTVDKIWDYFFMDGNIDRSAQYTNHCRRFENELDDDEKRVLASILTLLYFREQVSGAYYKINLETLKEIYVGTPLLAKLQDVVRSLKERHAIVEIGREYGIYKIDGEVEIDPEELFEDEDIAAELEEYFLDKVSKWDIVKNRVNLVVTSWRKAKSSKLSKLLGKLENHEVGIVVVFSKDDKSVSEVKETFKSLPQRTTVVVVGKPINDVWDKLEIYARMYKTAKKKGEPVRDYLNELLKVLKSEYIDVDMYYIFLSEKGAKKIWGDRNLKDEVVEMIKEYFPYGFEIERKVPSAPLWKGVNSKAITSILKGSYAPSGQDAKLHDLLFAEWKIIDRKWNLVDDCPDNIPICRMRKVIRELFEEREEVTFNEIWEILNSSPFGLYRSLGAYIILAVLMKEYLDYHYSDGKDEGLLNSEKLKEIIVETLKNKKTFTLKRLSKAQKKFIEFAKEVFMIDKDINSIQKTIDTLRAHFKTIGYPIWILKHHFGLMEFSKIFEILGKILRDYSQSNPMKNEMERLYEELGGGTSSLNVKIDILKSKRIHQSVVYYEAFRQLLSSKGLGGYDPERIRTFIEERMQEDVYRWDEKRFENVLDSLVNDIRYAEKLKEVLDVKEIDLILPEEVVEHFKSRLEFPLWIYEYHPDLQWNRGLRELIDYLENPTKKIDLKFISMESVKRVFEDPISALKEKIRLIYPKESESVIVRLAETVISELSKKALKKIDENHLKLVLERAYEKIGAEKLKNELKSKIENKLGTDLEDYLRRIGLSIAILDEDRRNIVKNLMDMDNLSKEHLGKLKESMDEFLDWVVNLESDSIEDMYLKFLSTYDENIVALPRRDFRDFLKHLLSEFDAPKLEPAEIVKIYKNWFEDYYENRVKPMLLRDFKELDDETLNLILNEIMKDPKLGFKIYRIIEEMNEDEDLS